MMLARFFPISCLSAAALLLVPAAARAQWYGQVYVGGNHTQAADIHIVQSSPDVDLTYTQVPFEGKSFEGPLYYGYRVGRAATLGPFGLEFEFTHQKVYAKTVTAVTVEGTVAGAPVAGVERMDERVGRYSMSHGLNFLLANLVWRRPIGSDRSAVTVRGGLGPTLPHSESEVFGVERQQYEWAGLGLQAAAGLDLGLAGPLSAVVEYKLTYAQPSISIANGTGETTALSHHVAVGLGVRLSPR